MTIFLDIRCKKCGEFMQANYDSKRDQLVMPCCYKCGGEISSYQKEHIRHSLDGLVSAIEKTGIDITAATFLNH